MTVLRIRVFNKRLQTRHWGTCNKAPGPCFDSPNLRLLSHRPTLPWPITRLLLRGWVPPNTPVGPAHSKNSTRPGEIHDHSARFFESSAANWMESTAAISVWLTAACICFHVVSIFKNIQSNTVWLIVRVEKHLVCSQLELGQAQWFFVYE